MRLVIGCDEAGLDYTDVREGVAVTLEAASTNVEVDVTLADGADAVAVAGRVLWGCGVHPSIVTSSLRAIVSAVNRSA